jgi:hypothetical protein
MATGAPNAILAINSLDRYIKIVDGNANQPFSRYLESQYDAIRPFSNDFIISSPGALIYGYINRIVVSQIQVQYNVPTVINGLNDIFYIAIDATDVLYPVTIPYGFYTPNELAAVLQVQINAVPALGALTFVVNYDTEDGFQFDASANFYFPDLTDILGVSSQLVVTNVLKTYRLLGINLNNSKANPPFSVPTNQQISFSRPNFLYTPYIDFYSDVLTNYQNIKDTNTSVAKPKGLIARVYLSGNGSVQYQTPTAALGSSPFVVTADMNSPKIIKWTPDVAVNSIDFQLRDCYGDLLPTNNETDTISTEFQMTLLCVEDDR